MPAAASLSTLTPLEPEWEGHVTLEFSNTTTLPAKIYANEGVAQMLFFESDEVCETSYADRGGKYQGAARRYVAEGIAVALLAGGRSRSSPATPSEDSAIELDRSNAEFNGAAILFMPC